jgi:cytochrome c553
MNRRFLNVVSAVSVAAVLLMPIASHAADIAQGKQKAEAVCVACHGVAGNAPTDPSYPRLAGQHQDYLVRALTEYKNGGRKNAIMAGQAQGLSKAEIENIAAYYASQSGSLYLKK